jgi:CheY-like chemotaxis protein
MTNEKRPLLVVEDTDEDYEILVSSLRNAGVPNELVRCSTGSEISAYLTKVLSMPASERPMLIFLDLNLPGADGRRVLRDLRLHPALKAVPVLVLTTSTHGTDIELCYKTGASGYLVKPVDLDKFESMVRQLCAYWFSCVRLPDNVTPVLAA